MVTQPLVRKVRGNIKTACSNALPQSEPYSTEEWCYIRKAGVAAAVELDKHEHQPVRDPGRFGLMPVVK